MESTLPFIIAGKTRSIEIFKRVEDLYEKYSPDINLKTLSDKYNLLIDEAARNNYYDLYMYMNENGYENNYSDVQLSNILNGNYLDYLHGEDDEYKLLKHFLENCENPKDKINSTVYGEPNVCKIYHVHDSLRCLELCVKYGADINIKGKFDMSLLDKFIADKSSEHIKFLISL